jgi:hypothetical protein
LFAGTVACVKPLIWETFTPLLANFSSNYLTLPFNFYIFCCLPFQLFYYESAWSISKF